MSKSSSICSDLVKLPFVKRIQEMDVQITGAEMIHNEAQEKVYADARGAKRGTEITVTVLAETDGQPTLLFTYVRASTAKSPDESSRVALHYRASITQTTGGGGLAGCRIDSVDSVAAAWKRRFPSPPSPVLLRSAQPRAFKRKSCGGLQCNAMEFEVETMPMAIDIPSDEGSHKVVIAVLYLDTKLEWCKVVNSSEFTPLPGEASVFMDDNFVSKSQIEHVAPNDSFKSSLGTDSDLRVTYPPVRTLNRTITQSDKRSVAAYLHHITIRNSRPAAVSALRVFDHVPISTDTRIKVNIISPNGLGPMIAVSSPGDENQDGNRNRVRSWTSVWKGVKVRWANLDVGGEGTVEWECEMQPNEEVELELSCEVSAPLERSGRPYEVKRY
ncbi:hypothetical protein FRC10_005034 [Ceratobasidium sp. 414]|nr:hypothetical protein FRC10_005034 [Ceratobasidium sp. 414]